jgi:beta-lactam-binding protein with PASTA domain
MRTAKLIAISCLAALALTGCRVTTDSPRAASGATVTAPKVVGQRLSAAEDAFDAAGFGKVSPVDGSDRHRDVLDGTNWLVTAQTPKAGAKVAAGTTVTLTVKRPSDGYGPDALTFGVVPGVKCMNLQDAQDALRKSGFLNLRSTDGSGKGRIPILDRDWVVTAQSVAANSRPSVVTRIVLTVVKYAEPTGSSGCPS